MSPSEKRAARNARSAEQFERIPTTVQNLLSVFGLLLMFGVIGTLILSSILSYSEWLIFFDMLTAAAALSVTIVVLTAMKQRHTP